MPPTHHAVNGPVSLRLVSKLQEGRGFVCLLRVPAPGTVLTIIQCSINIQGMSEATLEERRKERSSKSRSCSAWSSVAPTRSLTWGLSTWDLGIPPKVTES